MVGRLDYVIFLHALLFISIHPFSRPNPPIGEFSQNRCIISESNKFSILSRFYSHEKHFDEFSFGGKANEKINKTLATSLLGHDTETMDWREEITFDRRSSFLFFISSILVRGLFIV